MVILLSVSKTIHVLTYNEPEAILMTTKVSTLFRIIH